MSTMSDKKKSCYKSNWNRQSKQKKWKKTKQTNKKGNDDPTFGACLNGLGIYPGNTLDYKLRNRFGAQPELAHLQIARREDSWQFMHKPSAMGVKKTCCSDFWINEHQTVELDKIDIWENSCKQWEKIKNTWNFFKLSKTRNQQETGPGGNSFLFRKK